jgi:hypothetical protein
MGNPASGPAGVPGLDILDILLDDEAPAKVAAAPVEDAEADVDLLLEEYHSAGADTSTKKAALRALIALLK